MIAAAGEPVTASVLVGSVNGGEWIHVLLDALEHQSTAERYEVIVADRCRDGTAERIAREHPNVQIARQPDRTTLPVLRTLALDRARGEFVIVTEDHTLPPPHWIERLVSGLREAPPEVVAVGGLVDNAMRDGAVDWAAFLCEYSGYLPPQPTADVSDVAGMNIAYRRSAFDGVDRALLASGFWESKLHPVLLARGLRFRRLGDLVIGHRKHFGFLYFVSQRYHYSRHFAGTRFSPRHTFRRLVYAVLSVALPPVVLARVARGALSRPSHREPALRSLPALACFALAWGVGEAVGYLFGAGDSLARIE